MTRGGRSADVDTCFLIYLDLGLWLWRCPVSVSESGMCGLDSAYAQHVSMFRNATIVPIYFLTGSCTLIFGFHL